MPLITLANVYKTYRHGSLEVPALTDFSLCIEAGEFTVLAGPSGSGKTTVLNLVGVSPSPITAYDLALSTLSPDERACIIPALARIDTLSDHERRVFASVGACLTHKQSAESTGLATKSVSSAIDTIYEKLGLRAGNAGLNQAMLLAKIHLLYLLRQGHSGTR